VFLVLLTTAALTSVAAAVPAAQSKSGALGFEAPPSATEFASLVLASATASEEAHAESVRLVNVDCVRASSLDYMCSYAVTSPDRPRSCHLIQAKWTPRSTPNGVSLYTVTLAGRVRVCDSLHDALRSLR
jgi:hypothetical protein